MYSVYYKKTAHSASILRNSIFDRDLTFSNGVGVSFAVGDRQGLFVEHQMDVPENGGTSHSLNSGFTWLLSADTQVDLNASIGLNNNASDYALGFGYARRFR